VPAGTVSAVFSFVIDRGPNPNLVKKNHYFLYSAAVDRAPPLYGVVAYGNIVSPDFGLPFPPESHDRHSH
jgi:hypothetical protein